MSQFDWGIMDPDSKSGTQLAADLNSFRNALNSAHKGPDAPDYAIAGTEWIDDTTSAFWIIKRYDGAAWGVEFYVDTTNHQIIPVVGGGDSTIAGGATTDLWSTPNSHITISGAASISALCNSTAVKGTTKDVTFSGASTLVYNATSLILPGLVNFIAAAGDTARVMNIGSNNVAVVRITKANGKAVVESQQIAPATIGYFMTPDLPSGWVAPNGGTIGDGSSNGTIRANADTLALYTEIWKLSATSAPIFTSAGVSSTRGANAAADFAAHKALTIPDIRGVFLRGLDNSRGLDTGRVLGSLQSFATSVSGVSAPAISSTISTFAGDALAGHTHVMTTSSYRHGANGTAVGSWAASDGNQFNIDNSGPISITSTSVSGGTPSGGVSSATTTTVTLSGASETRPTNVSTNMGIKL